MTTFHAVVFVDHQQAQVLQFDAEHVRTEKIKAHTHHTKQHGSQVRSEHEFFDHVCDALHGVAEVLVTGPRTGLADFRHHVHKHRPHTARLIVAHDTADHPPLRPPPPPARRPFPPHDLHVRPPAPT